MITKPTLILDEQICRQNIEKMCRKAVHNGIDFRPHFKTHQSIEIGNWFKEYGVDKITVSSIEMAEYFLNDWDDITVAFPVNILQIDSINSLAERLNLNLLVESNESVEFLIRNLTHKIGAFVKIDVGYHRTGILSDNSDKIDALLDKLKTSSLIDFKGFLSHAGNTYQCRSKEEILKIHEQSKNQLQPLRNKYIEHFPDIIISVGDTPSCSVAEDFSMFNEIRPGNFVFYDLSQVQIGACEVEQIAVAVACPIVAIHKERNEIVVYGGGVHLSKDRLVDEDLGTIYGKVVEKEGNKWGKLIPEMFVKNLSQEHGIISVPESLIDEYKIGDSLFILPVHSCMTANLMDYYLTTDGQKIDRL